MTTARHARLLAHARRGFSLLEMLVVLAVLVIVMSIVIPALGNARNAAKKAATQGVMAGVATSIGQFKMDKGNLPGYFTVREMGVATNEFTMGENIMLDLAGGITTQAPSGGGDPCDPINGPQVIAVGPGNGVPDVNIELGRIGVTGQNAKGVLSRGYFTPDPKFFQRQCSAGQRAGAVGADWAMPVLVDSWGSPILSWAQDTVPAGNAVFASDNNAARAKFYRDSNYAFINATLLGKLGINQQDPSLGTLLVNNPGAGTAGALGALLGNPAFPNPEAAGQPAEARAPIVMHSAGANGIYLGRNERGGKSANATGGLKYAPNQDPITGGGFDDFLVTAQ